VSRFARARSTPTVEGRRAVLEALRAGRTISRILVAEGIEAGPQVSEALTLATSASIPVETLARQELDRRAATKHHQGIIALAGDPRYASLDAIISSAQSSGAAPLIAVLDGIQDPQNLGAIARTVDAAGGHGIVIQERRAVGVTPGALRASAGALEHVPVARVVNLNRALDQLSDAGIWLVGLDMQGDTPYTKADLTRPTALVIGSEGEGLSRLTREKCEVLVSIPLRGKLASLNASAAAAIALFEAVRQRN
jgi:23S rRNA (guanosine2251-2'-O)-methyltransferase